MQNLKPKTISGQFWGKIEFLSMLCQKPAVYVESDQVITEIRV